VAVVSRSGSRDSRGQHELFREALRGLDARGFPCRPEYRQCPRLKSVNDACFQRSFRAYQCEVNPLFFGECSQLLNFIGENRHAARESGNAWVARSGEDFSGRIVAAEFPGERVLAPSAADDQNLHPKACSRSAIRSPTSSTPHESLRRSSLIPSSLRRSTGTDACVIDAG
jgi:hypothetical protein